MKSNIKLDWGKNFISKVFLCSFDEKFLNKKFKVKDIIKLLILWNDYDMTGRTMSKYYMKKILNKEKI